MGAVRVGWLGDRLFLQASEGLGAEAEQHGAFYADDLTPDAPTGRSRWTRQHAQVVLHNMGMGSDLDLRLTLQGWPADVLARSVPQPRVTVAVDGTNVGTITPTAQWAEYTFTVPARLRRDANLTLDLTSSATFTATLRGADPRPKGVRLANIAVQSRELGPEAFLPLAPRAAFLLAAAALLLYLLLSRLIVASPVVFVLTTLGAGAGGLGLALARIWMGAALEVALATLGVALLLAWQQPILELVRLLLRRYAQGLAVGYGLVVAGLAWLSIWLLDVRIEIADWSGGNMRELLARLQRLFPFPDALLYILLLMGLFALILVRGREGLPRLSNSFANTLRQPRFALGMLLILSTIWIGYQALIIADLPYVGHADYADNAVVARNLVAGRGWVVDYVTQFYQLYAGITRNQETWPLLQPVWIAPFFALFGPQAWAAKIPNLLFNGALIALIYTAGTRLWDRRVGLTAAIITLTNYLFFRLAIYTTSDLAFVVFGFGAIMFLYRAALGQNPPNSLFLGGGVAQKEGKKIFRGPQAPSSPYPLNDSPRTLGTQLRGKRTLLVAALLTGLMMLQKPSGALLALGMGLWFMRERLTGLAWRTLPAPRLLRELVIRLRPVALWGIIALLLLSPYLLRNMLLFGKPVYSTESYDAWVLGYRGDGLAWEDIYRVYDPSLGGSGVPDRSWILRWGFDHTGDKFMTQLGALRDYLLPAWAGTGVDGSISSLFSRNERKNILAPLGAWLALMGLIAGLRFRRQLIALLAFAYVPYMLFMLTYWRANEERYWVMLIPWMALLAAWMIWAGFTRLAAIGDGRWSPLGLVLACVAIITIVAPSWADIAAQVRDTPPKWQADLVAYEWLRTATPPDAVVLARNPWQLNWHAERAALMIPQTADRDLLLQIAHHYGANYLILESLLRIKGDAATNLAPLLRPADARPGMVIDGFTLVYISPTPDNRVLIYQLPGS